MAAIQPLHMTGAAHARGVARPFSQQRLPPAPCSRRLQRLPHRPSNCSSGRQRSRTLRVVADSTSHVKGLSHSAEHIEVKSILGEGSFGTVYKGLLEKGGTKQHVVLKRVKQGVQGADEMAEMEHMLNVYTARAARTAVADFLGYCDVDEAAARSNKRLTPGLWLLWRYEGANTLAYYLRRRDCLSALSRDLGVPQDAVVATVMKQVFEALQSIHAAGVVHRDIKPHNMVLSEPERRFKLIDLGAAADLRNGTNYVPNESILDPLYCAPEQYILPTQSPDLAKMVAPVSLAMSPLVWRQWNPDRFDMYSAGLVLMQMALTRLRTPTQLRNFSTALEAAEYDLEAWRETARLPSRDTTVLDAKGGAGWKLAAALLRPRRTRTEGDGHVSFVGGDTLRPSAVEALQFSFITLLAVDTADVDATTNGEQQQDGTTSSSGGTGAVRMQRNSSLLGAASLFKRVAESLFDIEAKLVNQASATQKQAGTVRKLRKDVAEQRADAAELQREEVRYDKMNKRLGSLANEFEEQAGVASGLMAKLGLGKRKAPKAKELLETIESTVVVEPEPSTSGRSRMPTWAKEEVLPSTTSSTPSSSSSKGGSSSSRGGSKSSATSRGSGGREVISVNATSSTPSPPSSSSSPAAAEPAGSPRGGGGFGGWGNAFSSAFKFTTVALTAATDLVSKASRTAEEVAAEASARRKASSTFVEALESAQPPVTQDTPWDDAWAQLQSNPNAQRWTDSLTRAQLRQLFSEFQVAVRRAAEADFQQMLRQAGVGPDSTWDGIVDAVSGDSRYAAMGSEEEARRVFGNLVAELRGIRRREAAAAGAERGFRQLLAELDTDLLVAGRWSVVRPMVRDDVRFAAVESDSRCRELFREAVLETRARQGIEESGVAEASAPAAPAAKKPANASAATNGSVATNGSGAARSTKKAAGVSIGGKAASMLGELRKQHARLREEYEVMEAKLRQMEEQLDEQELEPEQDAEQSAGTTTTSTTNGKGANGSNGAAAHMSGTQRKKLLIQQDASGHVTFSIGDELSQSSSPSTDAQQPKRVK